MTSSSGLRVTFGVVILLSQWMGRKVIINDDDDGEERVEYSYNFLLQLLWFSWMSVWTTPELYAKIMKLLNQPSHEAPPKPVISQNNIERIIHLVGITICMLLLCSYHPTQIPKATSYFDSIIQGVKVSLGILECLGYLIFVSGICFVFYSRIYLGEYWRGTPAVREDHKLITDGPYSYLRHPIYTGIMVMTIGCIITSHFNIFSVSGSIGVYLFYLYKSLQEEEMLKAHFGAAYLQYQSRTWRILPFL